MARLSGGRIGWAVTALQDPSVLDNRRAGIEILMAIRSAGKADRIELAQQLSRDESLLASSLQLWLSWWRDLMLVKSNITDPITNADHVDTLRSQAMGYSLSQITQTINSVQKTVKQVDTNVNKQLALEVLLLSMPS